MSLKKDEKYVYKPFYKIIMFFKNGQFFAFKTVHDEKNWNFASKVCLNFTNISKTVTLIV
jgi:hypothetical protein